MLDSGIVRTLPAMGRRLLTDRRGRVALTVAGVTLGVSLFTGSLLTTTTATKGFDDFARETSGQADVVATAPGGTIRTITTPRGGELDGGVVDELAALPGVDRVSPLLVVPSSFEGPAGRTEQRVNFRVAAALVGADLDEAGSLYPVAAARGRLPEPAADEIALPERVAQSLGATVGVEVSVEHASRMGAADDGGSARAVRHRKPRSDGVHVPRHGPADRRPAG